MFNKVIPNDNIAYQNNHEIMNYQELFQLANKYSNYLKTYPNNIIIYGSKGTKMIISILACLLAKKTYIPIDSSIPINRIKKIIASTNSQLIINCDHDLPEINSIKLEDLSLLNKEYQIKNDIAYIIFTSGSTGDPKGVPITYSNLNNFIDWFNSLYPLNRYQNIKVFNQASYSFDLSVAAFYYSLTNNHTLVDLENIDDVSILKECTLGIVTPTFIKLCLLDNEFNCHNYDRLDCLLFCGEQLDKKEVIKLYSRFPEIKIINAYGPTEATCAVSAINITKNMLEYETLPIGDMSHNATTIEIIDNEIVLSGKSVFKGYLNSNNIITKYHTQDIGYINNNKLYYKGRINNQIKYKGYRIELEDVENNIKNINGVIDCLVQIKVDHDIVKYLKALVILDHITIEELTIEIKKLIPEYMIPKIFEEVSSLPINSNGKLDRRMKND